MKPVLYSPYETDFLTQGLGVLSDTISCTVVEELNGEYELTMQYPVGGIHYFEIEDRAIICAKPSPYRDPQPFRVYLIEAPISGVVTIHAHHLSYDLSGIPVSPFSANTCSDALSGLVTNSAVTNPFYVWTDKVVSAPYQLKTPKSFRACLGGEEDSILDVYGAGEYEFDKYAVRLRTHRGSDNGVRVVYGKNLTDFNMERNLESLVTGVYPYWADFEGNHVVELAEKVIHVFDTSNPSYLLESGGDYLVDSNGNYLMVQTPFPYENVITVDLTDQFEEAPTNAQLKAAARKYIKDNALGVPRISLNVSFVDLSRVADYKDLAILEYVDLADTITVEFPLYGISAKAEIVRIEFNPLTEQYDSVTIGNTRATIAETISSLTIGSATLTQVKTYSAQVADAPIPADRIQAGTLGADVIIGGFIGADSITAGTLGADIIYGGTISADNITAGTLGADIIYGGTVDADHINAGTLDAGVIYSGTIDASQITSGTIDASQITVTNLDADNITSGTIDASVIDVTNLDADNITSGTIDASLISVTNIDASNITTGYLSGSVIQAGTITANMLDTAYAEIDLANVILTSGEAIVTNTGYINNATITDLTTNRLRVLGKDGLYYAINVDGGAVSAATADADLATYGTQITGQTIIDGTVTAQKIYVTDLYALNATIGGLKIASGSIYSGTKTSLDTGIGLYMDSTGQLGLVGANGYLKFYDDNGSRKLSIVADSLFLGSTDVENLEYTVEIQVTAINYEQNTATLSAQPYKNGATQTASSFTYTWVKVKNGTRTTLATTTSQLSVTDLDAIYEVVVN